MLLIELKNNLNFIIYILILLLILKYFNFAINIKHFRIKLYIMSEFLFYSQLHMYLVFKKKYILFRRIINLNIKNILFRIEKKCLHIVFQSNFFFRRDMLQSNNVTILFDISIFSEVACTAIS